MAAMAPTAALTALPGLLAGAGEEDTCTEKRKKMTLALLKTVRLCMAYEASPQHLLGSIAADVLAATSAYSDTEHNLRTTTGEHFSP